MKTMVFDGKLILRREDQERDPLLSRLSRIEGQVRGLRQMVEADRYCGDELVLASAILAAVRETMRLLVAQHIDAGLGHISQHPEDRAVVTADFAAVLRPLLREQ